MQEIRSSVMNVVQQVKFDWFCFFEHNYFSPEFNTLFILRKNQLINQKACDVLTEFNEEYMFNHQYKSLKLYELAHELFSEWKGLRDIDNKNILYIPKRSPRNCSKK